MLNWRIFGQARAAGLSGADIEQICKEAGFLALRASRAAIRQAMRIMGGQYVLGRTIEEAIQKGSSANRPGTWLRISTPYPWRRSS